MSQWSPSPPVWPGQHFVRRPAGGRTGQRPRQARPDIPTRERRTAGGARFGPTKGGADVLIAWPENSKIQVDAVTRHEDWRSENKVVQIDKIWKIRNNTNMLAKYLLSSSQKTG